MLEPVVEMDVLLLDDLGAWKMTDWMNDTLFYILNSRYMAKRPTIITTNYQDVTREEALAADSLRRREFLVERIGQRLRSRLMEMCRVVRMQGSRPPPGAPAANQVALRRPGRPRGRIGRREPATRSGAAMRSPGQRRRDSRRPATRFRPAVGGAAGRERARAGRRAFLVVLVAGGLRSCTCSSAGSNPLFQERRRRPVVGDRHAAPPSATATSTRSRRRAGWWPAR